MKSVFLFCCLLLLCPLAMFAQTPTITGPTTPPPNYPVTYNLHFGSSVGSSVVIWTINPDHSTSSDSHTDFMNVVFAGGYTGTANNITIAASWYENNTRLRHAELHVTVTPGSSLVATRVPFVDKSRGLQSRFITTVCK